MLGVFTSLLVAASLASGRVTGRIISPYGQHIQTRQECGSGTNNASSATVDLGYSVYQGIDNTTTGLNTFLGIRYAAPPIGTLRWQSPQPPTMNRSHTMNASEFGHVCPQSYSAGARFFEANETGLSEDCLFLNVWSPNNASEPLPVYVYIHGGGYGQGSSQFNMPALINTNQNTFVGISIQYRLGAFGFLAGDEVFQNGVVNAGLLDQHMALHWVQQYVHLFNGDPTRVTIGGESAGGGSVMLQDTAYGGSIDSQLFTQSFLASPYLPQQYGYKDWQPSQAYYAFATAAGCGVTRAYGGNNTETIFDCLVNSTSDILINASDTVSQTGVFGTWAFLPVTDGVFVQDLPSRQLNSRRMNGVSALIGNNANEGTAFVPPTISTETELIAYLHLLLPLFSDNDIAKLLYYYPSTSDPVDTNAPLFATSGDSSPTALNQSSLATGQQQRAFNIYAESTFVCPTYWLAEAYSSPSLTTRRKAYRYQFSALPGVHGADLLTYQNPPDQLASYPSDLSFAVQAMLGNFITTGNPSISNQLATGLSLQNNGTYTNSSSSSQPNPITSWPPYSISAPYMIDLNTTCGTQRTPFPGQEDVPTLDICTGPGVRNDFRLVDAYTWEGGRGIRCDFWRAMGEIVPE